MAPSTPRPPWGWTAAVRLWLTVSGALAALGLIVFAGTGPPPGPIAPAPRLIVDPNTAPPAVLGALPRLGPAVVGRIVAAREKAPFRSLDDLDIGVRGIGPATLASLRPYLHIERSPNVTTISAAAAKVAAAPGSRRIRLARTP